ncbi:MAG: DUF1698 domain-containing protein, partial [Methylococcales bacterium]|nr:DUF1698 domain-containing protein [Methylococcales bacterium]
MFDYNPLFDKIEQSCLRPWLKTLPSQIDDFMSHIRHGDFEKWTTTLNSLPNIPNIEINLKSDSIKLSSNTIFSATEQTQLEQQLRQFEPWRKGPFDLFGLPIDTEWRSDWKWNRLQQAIQPLTDKKILDVGCGNG